MFARSFPAIFSLLSSSLVSLEAAPTAPAFPGAEGAGAWATGGRGGKVIMVTNLNDDGPGSLRTALKTAGPRTVLFSVSGTISLASKLGVDHGDLTIAGQSAPGGGICIKGYGVDLSDAKNVIVRHIRFRPGDEAGKEMDAIGGRNCENIIIDHCSASWSVDETFSFYDSKKLTVQWCIVSESLFKSVHAKGEHGYGGIWGGSEASWHHNLLACHTSRNPRFSRDEGTIDFRNNVISNWGFNSSYGGERCRVNVVGNFYQPGPATQESSRYRIVDISAEGSRWFIEENWIASAPEMAKDNWQGGVQRPWGKESDVRSLESFPAAWITTQSPAEARELVLQHAGATLPKRDQVDDRIVKETRDGVSPHGKSYQGGRNGIIDRPADVGGWPSLESTPAPTDTDADGMPDAWEMTAQFDPKNPADAIADADTDGYTNLEEFLNQTSPRNAEPALEARSMPVVTVKPTQPALFYLNEITVAADGSKDVTTIQEAIALAPSNREKTFTIKVEEGTYTGPIVIPSNKPMLKLRGKSPNETIITGALTLATDNGKGGKLTAQESATLLVQANDFAAEKLTIQNSHGPGIQALAAFIVGDRASFKDCQFLGWQDTLRIETGRSYFNDCTIAGSVDFIYGSGTGYFDKCVIHCRGNGCITAPSTPAESPYGFVFSKCLVTAEVAVQKMLLGRPWKSTGSSLFLKCTLPSCIEPRGWDNWQKPENEATARFGEYENEGPGAATENRVPWSKQLSKDEGKLNPESVLAGSDRWNPTAKR